MEGPDSLHVNAIVAREDNKDSKKIQELKAAFQTSEVAEKAKEVYKGDADQRLGKPGAGAVPADGVALYPRHRERSGNQIKTGAPSVARHRANRQLCGGKRQPGNDIRPSRRLPWPALQAGSNAR